MSKREIIKKIRELTGCTEEKAEIIFKEGLENEHIIVRVNWEWIINRVIIAAIIITGLWALWRHIG
tara:strand:+ start:516 stop:713 length:198 start_codon:yes stop_codon:yes gene_type:complete